ncbi:MAG TPA: amidohydrolase family protein [Stellaceae bacterium]|jgi:predicted TIM-barrel fold metal-dependent hydrolase
MARPWIDVHGHFLPPNQELSRSPGTDPDRSWAFSPETNIAYMDRTGVAAQIISYPGQLGDGERIAAANTYGATLVEAYPKRFGFLAQLPMSDPAGAVAEIGRGINELGAEGFAVLSNRGGIYLGDPRYEPVWNELDRNEATLFIHPTTRGFEATRLGRNGGLIEGPFDTARTVVDMIFAGVFRRYPRFKIILAHGGGALPALAGRLMSMGPYPRGRTVNPHKITEAEMRDALARFYYDTGLAGTVHSLEPVLAVTTPDHVLYGTDFGAPCTNTEILDLHREALRSYPRLSEAQREALGTNVLPLFPKFAERIGLARDKANLSAAAE